MRAETCPAVRRDFGSGSSAAASLDLASSSLVCALVIARSDAAVPVLAFFALRTAAVALTTTDMAWAASRYGSISSAIS